MYIVSIFQNYHQPVDHDSLEFVLEQIRGGYYKNAVKKIRAEEDEQVKENLTNALPAISIAGMFKIPTQNQKAGLVLMAQYNGLFHIYIPYLDPKDMKKVKRLLLRDAHVYAFFVDAAGEGLNIIARGGGSVLQHGDYFRMIKDYYKNLLDVSHICKKGEELDALCFYSYDPDLYLNTSATILPIAVNARATR